MNEDGSAVFSIVVGILCFFAFILLFLLLRAGVQSGEATIRLPSLVLIGIMALFATLALVALTFSVAGLTDPSQALGLPEGSVRAAIALSLIVIFSITSFYLYASLAATGAKTGDAASDFAKQIFAVVGTLMTSVASFYFASRVAAPVTAGPKSSPKLISVAPTETVQTPGPVVVPVKISGTDLQLAKTVTLEMAGGHALLATEVSSNEQLVKCDVTIDAGVAPGKYDVVVRNSDDAKATLPSAFEVRQQAGAPGGNN